MATKNWRLKLLKDWGHNVIRHGKTKFLTLTADDNNISATAITTVEELGFRFLGVSLDDNNRLKATFCKNK